MRVVKCIPNAITSLNLLCGVLGVIAALSSRPDLAFPLMLCAAVADFCDGLAARLLGAYSDIGKELDSLSDMVSFGVLPSLLLYNTMRTCTFSNSLWCFSPLLLAVASGFRLAKFNIDERQHDSFLGLPTPAAAMICGSLSYFIAYDQSTFLAAWATGYLFIPLLAAILSLLLVSEIPMFSIKFGKGTSSDRSLNLKRLAFVLNLLIIVAIVASLGLNWSLTVLLGFVTYILMNVVFALLKV